MIKFSYDNTEADKLILEFKCKKCSRCTKTEKLSIPQLDLETFQEAMDSFEHRCQCGTCYKIDVFNSLNGGYGLIHGMDGSEGDVNVLCIPDIWHDKNTILVDTICSFYRIENIVNDIDVMCDKNKNYIYNLLFSNLITIIDSFVKIYTAPIILSNNDLIENFSNSFNFKGSIEEKKEKIKNFYNRRSFQIVSNQKKLFEDVLKISIDIDNRIEQYVSVRNVIIHRNSIGEEGGIYNIKKTLLLQALEVVENYIRRIHIALLVYEFDSRVNKIMNR